MSEAPKCELYAGRGHDEDPPAAVGEFLLKWTGAADGAAPGGHRSVVRLCRSCYDTKAAEFRGLARERGNGNCVEVITRYPGGERLPLHAGACDRRAPGGGRQ